MLRIILEGGSSDTQLLDLDADHPPPHLDRAGEVYAPVLSHFDEHLRDITGRWRYRYRPAWQEMQPGHSALAVKP